MTDPYLRFARLALGGKLAGTLGLPKPPRLERYRPGQAVIERSHPGYGAGVSRRAAAAVVRIASPGRHEGHGTEPWCRAFLGGQGQVPV